MLDIVEVVIEHAFFSMQFCIQTQTVFSKKFWSHDMPKHFLQINFGMPLILLIG